MPLQSWLGDAMEGPTPVSALIHAATMVTAGVYLIVRSAAVFNGAPDAQLVVTIVGAVTLLFGAIVGCAKDDIKKALAGSTMSQIGYMILAAGLGPIGYAFAIMHLVTHGFFKAGLFLGAGSVMHGMNDEVDMRRYGGLRTYMPVTFVTFGLGYLAIIGFPGLSGFFSKDKIIESAFAKGGTEGITGLARLRLLVPAGTRLSLRNVKLLPRGVESIFNGKDLTGWKVHPGKKSKFVVTDSGELNVKDGPGDVQTEKKWADFVLQLECISHGKHLNSGVFFRCRPGEYQQGYEAQIRPRSGLAAKNGVTVLNAPGTIDADYRGEVGVILINHGDQDFTVTRGMRIAQMVVAPVSPALLHEVAELPDTARGSGGFGSTGTGTR